MKSTIIFALCVAYVSAQAGCPRIISRAEWGARPPSGTTPLNHPVSHAVIHHSAGAQCFSQSACTSQVQGIQNYHMDTNGWSDIGYNFLAGDDNNIYEGRGWNNVGAHAPNYNSISIGTCFLGTFTSMLPGTTIMNNVKQLIQCGASNGYISSSYKLVGHRQVTATECPGDALYAEIQSWPNWTSNP